MIILKLAVLANKEKRTIARLTSLSISLAIIKFANKEKNHARALADADQILPPNQTPSV